MQPQIEIKGYRIEIFTKKIINLQAYNRNLAN